MHELSLCEGILQILEQQARQQGGRRVRQVWLEIGALSPVDIGALRFAFEAVTRDTLAEGAILHIDETAARAWCPACARRVTVSHCLQPCPECGGQTMWASGGDDMRIREMEVE